MPSDATQKQIYDRSTDLIILVKSIRDAAIGGRDSHDYAAKVAVLAQQLALASTDFCETLSEAHCETLDIIDETPCENPDDFADWAKRVAHDRSYAPFEGVRCVRRSPAMPDNPYIHSNRWQRI